MLRFLNNVSLKMSIKDFGRVLVILGCQWGDEGKGKIVDLLSNDVDIVARTGGGSNAGHTVVIGDLKYKLHLIPSGVLYDNVECFVGNGVVVHLPSFLNEVEYLENSGINCRQRIFISDRAHLLFDFHQLIDEANENAKGDTKIGTTKMGIGPCYCSKADRLLVEAVNRKYSSYVKIDGEAELQRYRDFSKIVQHYIVDGIVYINKALELNKNVIIEGANAVMLDLDFGTYPYVTSSNPTIGGCITGMGIPITEIKGILGVVKAYTTRVGSGPFPTELDCHVKDSIGYHMLHNGAEYGTTTSRPRRCGWLDLMQLSYSAKINGYTHYALTKLDVLTGIEEIKVAIAYTHNGKILESFPSSLKILSNVHVQYRTFPGWKTQILNVNSYDELPVEAKNFVTFIESSLRAPIKFIGTGPSRDSIIIR